MLAKLQVYGRNRYFYHLRNHLELSLSENDKAWTWKELPDTASFEVTVPYQAWMNGARLSVNECVLGCCNKTLSDTWAESGASFTMPVEPDFSPKFIYLKPKAEVHKERFIKAVAYVDFPVSQTTIYPEYRNNPVELAKITNTVDSLLHDKDIIKVERIFLKGYASPESPYDNNYRLAKGRTAAIKSYLANFSHLSMSLIDTDFEPENWQGLRDYVLASDLPTKEGILKIIDSHTIAPDPKEELLKKQYPEEYKYLHENCYPALRKVDYEINYLVKVFTDIEEIRAAFFSAPSKLSLDEFYYLSQSYPEDSEEFRNVILTAVRMFPKDQVANLNAANIAMAQGRLKDAGAHLDKAGDTFEATYARGIYSALTGDYARAEEFFERVKDEISQAGDALEQVKMIAMLKSLWKK